MHSNKALLTILENLDLGASIAEEDTLLETARIETSAFSDVISDRVDLNPGTKGSGKSSLFRILTDFMPTLLLSQRKVVVAHGVQSPGDPVFHAFNKQFEKLSEDDFVNFWCIYLVSLAHEQFIKGDEYKKLLVKAQKPIDDFRLACEKAKIPEIQSKKSLKSILEWSLNVLSSWRPKIKIKINETGCEVDLFGNVKDNSDYNTKPSQEDILPRYLNDIKLALDEVLKSTNLSLWLMIDRLDEIFPRRTELERKALRGLLRAMRFFNSSTIRVKIFLRDDMLEQVTGGDDGFTALTHITARQADTLRWTEDQILTLIMKRFLANDRLVEFLQIDKQKAEASFSYKKDCFYKIFPATVFRGPKQSATINWICNRCADGRGVYTPRDVIDLLIRAKQKQQDFLSANLEGVSDYILSSSTIQYGFEELSKRRRDTYLKAEFPHLWGEIQKFEKGKTSYSEKSLANLLGPSWKKTSENLISIGFLSKSQKENSANYTIPFLYRPGMDVTQGMA
jgi:hypothetical protein